MFGVLSKVEISKAMTRVYFQMFIGLALTGLVAVGVAAVPALQAFLLTGILKWVFLLAPLALVFWMSLGYEKLSAPSLHAIFLSYAALNGVSLSILFAVYTLGSLLGVVLCTSALFAVLTIYGLMTKRSLDSWGSFLFIGLIMLIIVMIVNMFLQLPALSMAISAVAVLIFMGLTAYDTQKIKETIEESGDKGVIMGALSLYLDFLNLVIHLLNLLGVKK